MSHNPADSLPETVAAWHPRVWRLAWPTIIANASVPVVGMVDTAVVGHLASAAPIGAVAIGAVVFHSLLWVFAFLRMGTTGFTAQALGAGDAREVNAGAVRAALLALVIGAVLLALKLPIERLALDLVEPGEQVRLLAAEYIGIRLWAAPAMMLNMAVLGVLFGLQRMRHALWVQLTLNVVNIALDLYFVHVLGLGVAGVAWATVVAEYLSAALGVLLAWRALVRVRGPWRGLDILHAGRLRALAVVNVNIFLRTLAVQVAFFYFTVLGARQGDVVLAANAVLLHMLHLLAYALDGFAFAVEALAGNAYGARRPRALRAACLSATLWSLLIALAFAIAYALAGQRLAGLMTSVPEVLALTETYLPWMIAAPLVSVWSYLLDGIYFGTTHTREMRNGMLISTLLFLACTWWLVPLLGNHGLWLSVMVLNAARAATLAIWYPRIERHMRLTPHAP